MRAIVRVVIFMSCSIACGCAVKRDRYMDPPDTSFEFHGVKFKTGAPQDGESLGESLKPPASEQFRALRYDAGVLKDNPVFAMEIIGFTDDRECAGQACYELSARRAALVHRWLVDHGVSHRCLRPPLARGGEIFIDTNETEDGRQHNRRAEINVVDFNCK